MQPSVAVLGAVAHHGRLAVRAASAGAVRSVGAAVMPGGFDEQPAGVAVAGLGDRALGAWAPEEYSAGTKPR
jgi:hypothetical protein